MLPANADQYYQVMRERVGLSSQRSLLHWLEMILPSVGHPCKFQSLQVLNKFPAKLNGKESQGDSTGQVDEAEKCWGYEFASPGDEGCHDKTPEDRAA